tara:strand:+ start:278 stop:1111 length:834 start_codon:yes stop_codon:yes gene_type:complete
MVRRAPRGFKDKAKGGKGKSLSKSAISRIMSAADSSVPGGSFSDLARADKQKQVKYDRPADLQSFVDKSKLYQEGIGLGGRVMDDGTLQMGGLRDAEGNPIILKNAAGQTVLSMSKPGITAVAPRNFSEAMGDIRRAFTGYNTLSYDPNAKGTPSTTGGTIVENQGIMSNFSPLSIIPGFGMASKFFEGAKDVYNFMFPPPAKVTYGSEVTGTVTEEPTGVMTAFPNNFETELKTKPEIPPASNFESLLDPVNNPALYGDGTFFDKFDEQLDTLGLS